MLGKFWPYLGLAFLIFLAACIAGYGYSNLDRDHMSSEYCKLQRELKDLMELMRRALPPLTPLQLAGMLVFVIFLNNALKSFLAMILGMGLGLVPLVFIWVNGFFIGATVGLLGSQPGSSPGVVVLALLPHGIPELFSVLASSGIGMRLGWLGYRALKGRRSDLSSEFKQGLSIFKYLILILAIAAFIEVFISMGLSQAWEIGMRC